MKEKRNIVLKEPKNVLKSRAIIDGIVRATELGHEIEIEIPEV